MDQPRDTVSWFSSIKFGRTVAFRGYFLMEDCYYYRRILLVYQFGNEVQKQTPRFRSPLVKNEFRRVWGYSNRK